MSIDADALKEMAANRGLKLRKSRTRDPAKTGFGKFGLIDKAGEPVFGFKRGKPGAEAEEIAAYLRGTEAQDWKASLKELGAKPRKAAVQAKTQSRQIVSEAPPKPKKEEPPQLRDAKPADAAQLTALFALLDHQIDAAAVAANLKAFAKAGEPVLVIVRDKEIIAACGVHRTLTPHRAKPVGRITILIVAEAFRGRGLGRRLVEEAERRLHALGCGIIEVTSNDRLTAAHAFYRHLGYQQTSMRFAKDVPSG